MLRESAGAPVVAAQWTAPFLPALALQCFVRFKMHERNALAHAAFEAEATSARATRGG